VFSGLTLFFQKNKIKNGLIYAFQEKAGDFKGLYNGINRIISGDGKSNYKPVEEFFHRLERIPECDQVCGILKQFFPLSGQSPKTVSSLCSIIGESMYEAGVYHDEVGSVIALTEKNALHYQEMNGGELYVGDRVRVISPAWYGGNTLLETGHCEIA